MRNGSITRSFRYEKDLDEQLENAAKREGMSVNSLAIRGLRKLVEWDIYAEKFGLITLSSTVFEKMLSAMDETNVREIGRWTGSNLAKEFMAIWFKKIDLDSAIKSLEFLGSKYGKAFEYEYSNDGHAHTIIINHSAGPKASFFYGEMLSALFGDMLRREIVLDGTDDAVIARVLPSKEDHIPRAPGI